MNTLFLPLPGRSCFLLSPSGLWAKWKSRALGGIFKRRGKVCSGTFPRSVFSTARFAAPTSCEVNHDDEP